MSVVRGRRMSRGSSRSRSRSASTRSLSLALSRPGGDVRRGPRRTYQSPYFNPFPSMMRNKLRYIENITLATVASSDDASVNYFSCNGIHDPNITGTGHQPYGHDTLATLYNHYRVDKAVIRLTPSTVGKQMIYGVAIVDETTGVSRTDQIMQERKNSAYRVMADGNGFGPSGGTITLSWTPDGSFPAGRGEQKNMNASYGSNPGEQMYFAVFARRCIPSLPALTTSYNVEIEYYVTSYELQPQDAS